MVKISVLTPTFLYDVLYLTVASILSSSDPFMLDSMQSSEHTRPGYILTLVELLLKYSQQEKDYALVKDLCKAIELLATSKDEINVPSLIVDLIEQHKLNVDISKIIDQINEDLSNNTFEQKLDQLVQQLQRRIEFLEVKPYLNKLKDLLDCKETVQVDDFLVKLKVIARSILEKAPLETSCITFDTAITTDLEKVVQEYKQILDPSQYVTTGYKALDELLYGGFAKTRIYVIAGPSGHGKSTYLLNWMVRAVRNMTERTFMYITLENIVPETLLRIASIIEGKNVLEEAINNPDALEQYLVNSQVYLQSGGNRVVIKYYSPTTPIDVIISDIKTYAKEEPPLAAVYYDYLNVMGLFSEDMRKHLGQIVRKLKDLAVDLQIPVITAAQLNREAYGKGNPQEVGLQHIAESMLIVENADVLLLTNNDQNVPNRAYLQIRKRRYAKEGTLMVNYNPDCYKVLSIKKITDDLNF